jgi:hypothetical protein
MCRNVSSDLRIEGWRAFVELLAKLRPRLAGGMTAALAALAALAARLQLPLLTRKRAIH